MFEDGESRMFRNENLYCILDRGRVRSVGRMTTHLGETIELGLCDFDAALSGFRWRDDEGWVPVFVRDCTTYKETMLKVWNDTPGLVYTEEEIALELERFFANKNSTGDPSQ